MSLSKQRFGKLTILATNAAIVAVITAFFVMQAGIEMREKRDQERLAAFDILTEFAESVSDEITNALLVGSAFKGAITLDPNLSQESFSRFAEEIVADHEAVINVATIRNSTVEFVHPYAENAHVIGRKLGDIPEQKQIAETAMRENKVIFQGPVPLLQGFPGFIMRVPVVLDSPNGSTPWGLISIVFSAESLIQNLHSEVNPDGFEIAMRKEDDGTVILGNTQVFSKDGIEKNVAVPNGTWTVAIAPKNGWAKFSFEASTIIVFLLLTTAVLATTNMLFRLRHEAAVRTEQLRSAIEVMGDGFVLYDADDRLVICNERYREIYSASAPAIKPGATFREILQYGLQRGQYEEAIGREEEWLEERMAAHLSADFTLEQKLEDGRWLRIREMATPDGGRVGIRVDITEQVESRERAEIAEIRLREAIDTVPAAFLLFDSEGVLETVNTQALQLIPDAQARMSKGTPIRKLLERLVFLEMPNETREERNERVEFLLNQLRRTSSQFDLHVGNQRYYKIVSHRTQEGGVVCFGLDISDLIAQERWLETTNQRLRAAIRERDIAEARFADVADIATEWFWEQDADMRLTYLSPGFEKATGAAPENALGKTRRELSVPGQNSALDEHIRLMEAREPFENVIYRSSMLGDKEAWFRTSGKPVFDEAGNFNGYIGTAADVTDLYSAVRRAEKADAAKTQFLNVISHELRTPMTVVLGYNAFLRTPEALPATRSFRDAVQGLGDEAIETGYTAMIGEIRGLADRIDSAGKQLQALIGDVLDLSRIESNTFHMDLGPVDLEPIVESTISQMQSLAQGKKITLETEIENATLNCDETRLRQVLINLISNAIKFTDHGSITVRSRIENDMMRIAVTDTGLGIPHEALENIFDRFTQADASSTRNEGGAGLGLAISKDIVRLHGGEIEVEDTSSSGTTIFFTIPLWKGEAAA